MYVTKRALVQAINGTPTKAVIITTGGGTEIFPVLMKRGGGSATVISGIIPYGMEETIDLMGRKPDRFVSEETARALAMAAYQRALQRRTACEPVIGVATTAVLQRTPDEREGRQHDIYAALQSGTKTVTLHLKIEESMYCGRTDPYDRRRIEEDINTEMLLNLIAEGCGLEDKVEVGIGSDVEPMILRKWSTIDHPDLNAFMEGKFPRIGFEVTATKIMPFFGQANRAVLPGSFNPCHKAHMEMAGLACEALGSDVDFELSVVNVDKAPLDLLNITSRLKSFQQFATGGHGGCIVWVSRLSTFVEKVKHFPMMTTFVVGYDTAKRIVDPKYAGNVTDVCETFFQRLTEFLVFPRGPEQSLMGFPDEFTRLATMCLTPMEYTNMSSTQIRKELNAT